MWGINIEWWILYVIIIIITLIKAIARVLYGMNVEDPYKDRIQEYLHATNLKLADIQGQLEGIAHYIKQASDKRD